MKVNLSEIIEGIDFGAEELHYYYNVKTGIVVSVSDEEFKGAKNEEYIKSVPDWKKEIIDIAREIMETKDYIELPSENDVDDYKIMGSFSESIEDVTVKNQLSKSIEAGGTFSKFRDCISQHDIVDEWYEYKDGAIKNMAISWCEKNNIEYID